MKPIFPVLLLVAQALGYRHYFEYPTVENYQTKPVIEYYSNNQQLD